MPSCLHKTVIIFFGPIILRGSLKDLGGLGLRVDGFSLRLEQRGGGRQRQLLGVVRLAQVAQEDALLLLYKELLL